MRLYLVAHLGPVWAAAAPTTQAKETKVNWKYFPVRHEICHTCPQVSTPPLPRKPRRRPPETPPPSVYKAIQIILLKILPHAANHVPCPLPVADRVHFELKTFVRHRDLRPPPRIAPLRGYGDLVGVFLFLAAPFASHQVSPVQAGIQRGRFRLVLPFFPIVSLLVPLSAALVLVDGEAKVNL